MSSAPESGAPPGARTVFRACPLCEATCGIAVDVDAEGRATAVRGDADDPLGRGYLCPKAHGLIGLQEDPDRLRRPVRRIGEEWREIAWDDAFALIGERLRGLRDARGADALAAYVGNPNVHDLGALVYLQALLRALGSKKRFSASSVDQLPKMLSSAAMFGGGLTIAVPDVDRTDFLLVLGANPLASNGSLLTAPDMRGRLRALRERGGQLVVVDPRRTETARIADEHLFIRPGTDAAFLFALVHCVFEEERVRLNGLGAHVRGLGDVRELARPFTPEATAGLTGIAAADTRRLAAAFAAEDTAVCYARTGTCMQAFGTLASWLVDVLNAITGNLDRPGGAMFPRAATSSGVERSKGSRVDHARWHSSVRGLPESFGELPAAALAEEIDAAGEGRIRALIAVAGNPVLSTPNGARLARALASLDFMVAVDLYVNETTRFADLILPPTSPLERSHYDLVFSGLAIRNVAKYSPASLEPPADGLAQWEILARLAGCLHGVGADVVDDLVLDAVLCQSVGAPETACPDVSVEEARRLLGPERGPERILDLMLRAGPYGDRFDASRKGLSLDAVKASPHGIDLGPLAPRMPGILTTESGAIELAPALVVADVPRLRAALDAPPGGGELLLIGRRHVRSNNSWMHNIHALAKGRDRCTLLVHPADAERLKLAPGTSARIRSRVGEVTAPVSISDEMMPGVVSLPHGYGHDAPAVRMRVAREHAGVNVNLLSDEEQLDEPSGNSVLNGVPVTISPA